MRRKSKRKALETKYSKELTHNHMLVDSEVLYYEVKKYNLLICQPISN